MTGDLARNFRKLWTLAFFEYKLSTKDLFLGGLWRLLNPAIQVGVYWFVFGIGLRNGQPIDGIPYVVWLTCGLTPWNIMNGCISRAAGSVRGKASMLMRSNIPTSLIPVSTTMAEMLNSAWSVLLLLVIFVGNGCHFQWTALCLVYYVLCMFAFLASFSLISSVLVMFAKDFANLLQAVLRLAFFATPIFWKPGSSIPEIFHKINFYNPFGYIVEGFRDSLLFNTPFWEDPTRMVTFWGIVAVLYLLGASFQGKLRKNLLDFL